MSVLPYTGAYSAAGAASSADAWLVVSGGCDNVEERLHALTCTMAVDPLLSPPRLLEVQHVAHRLSASQEFVRRLIREKKLAAIRLGTRWRVDPNDLQAFIDAQRVESQANGNGDGDGDA